MAIGGAYTYCEECDILYYSKGMRNEIYIIDYPCPCCEKAGEIKDLEAKNESLEGDIADLESERDNAQADVERLQDELSDGKSS